MPSKNWTEQQKAAIHTQGGPLLVSAAAGSGKTAVLVERVIRKITDRENPCDVDRMLVVTYTNAAAAELKERVAARLHGLAAQSPSDLNLSRQLMLIHNAHISTIHSFCLDMIRENFQKLNIPPDFRVADENEIGILRNDILEEVIEEFYALSSAKVKKGGEEPAFFELTELLSAGRDDSRLVECILRLYTFIRSLPDYNGWLDGISALYDSNLAAAQTVWGRAALDLAKTACENAASVLARALKAINGCEPMQKAYFAAFQNDYEFFKQAARLADEGNWDSVYRAVNSYSFGKLGALRKFEDEAFKDSVKAMRDSAKEILSDLRKGPMSSNADEITDDLKRTSPLVDCLFSLVKQLDLRLTREKLSRNILDFGDLEQFALKLFVERAADGTFRKTDSAEAVSKRFDEILVDEYQDVNFAQETIFNAVSDNSHNLFMVGDVKQSIYRFRQAMPEIFIGKKESYRPLPSGTSEKPEPEYFPAKIILGKNFRSREGVTAAVNYFFRGLMSSDLGEIDYGEEERLIPGAVYPPRPCGGEDFELDLLDVSKSDGSADFGTEDTETLEARRIAEKISTMIGGGFEVLGENGMRKAGFGDFCVLLRSTSTRAEKYMREMALCGIPAVADIPNGYLGSYEVAVMLSLLRVLDNPVQDIPLLSVMLSPIFGFAPDDVAEIRLCVRHEKLYFALLRYTRENGGRTADFLKTLERLRTLAAVLPVDTLIERIYEETGFVTLCDAMPGGTKRRANLRLLMNYARNYDEAGYTGLAGFIRFIDRLNEMKGDLAAGTGVEGGAGAVKIMSIHKSKGLEFPVCIVAGCSKKFNREDTRKDILFSPSYGVGLMLRDKSLGFRYTTLPREIVKAGIEKSSASEELRVLYVAMTRAREKLILLLSLNDIGKEARKAASLVNEDGSINPFYALKSPNFSEWILACALCHPSCGVLRQDAGLDSMPLREGGGKWEVSLSEPSARPEKEADKDDIDSAENSGIYETITTRLSFTYPYAALAELPSKLSVSEMAETGLPGEDLSRPTVLRIKRELRPPENPKNLRPSFLDKRLTPAEAGTALHFFMQHADFSEICGAADIEAEKKRFVEWKLLLPEQAEAVGAEKVLAFLKSDIYRRIRQSPKVFKEFKFNIEVPAKKLFDGIPENAADTVILQGISDLVFEENGLCYVLDYKTDRVSSGDELAERYAAQVAIYAEAVEQVTGKIVGGKYLYSFHLQQTVVLP